MTTESQPPLRVLLWSIKGAGERYHGPGSFAYRLFRNADPGRFELTLAHADPEQPKLDLFKEQHYIAPLVPSSLLSLHRFLRHSQAWLRENAHRFDVFFGLTAFHFVVKPAWFAQQHGLPSVVFVANHNIELCDKPGLKGLLRLPQARRRMAKDLGSMVAMSQAIHDELLSYQIPPERIARIPMGVDTDRFSPLGGADERAALRKRLGVPDRFTLVFSGGMVRRKRPDLLIESVATLAGEGHDVQVALAGPDHEADYVAEMRELVARRGIEDRVHWLGMMSNIEQAYQVGDVFSLPSSQEGMPAALVEALACGLPSLVTPISGCADLVEDGQQGFYVEQRSESLEKALRAYLNDADLLKQHAANARRKAVDGFSDRSVRNAYEALFRKLSSERKNTGS